MKTGKIMMLSAFLLWLAAACSNNNGESRPQPAGKEAETTADAPAEATRKTIVFFGNSLTAGYGLEPEQAFTTLIQQRVDSLGYPYLIVNAGVSGETTAGGNARVDWVLNQQVDIFILELGGNDGLRGIDPTETRKNLKAIIDKVKAAHPGAEIILAGMEAPPNMGPEYTSRFRKVFSDLASENELHFIPFILEGVGGEAQYNQSDGIHPNPEGSRIVAENIWEVLEPLLEKS